MNRPEANLPPVEQPDRSEIERWVKIYSDAWKAYDDIETGKTIFPSRFAKNLAQNEINWCFKKAMQWLWEHGISDETLAYNRETKTYSLPAAWQPPDHKQTPTPSD